MAGRGMMTAHTRRSLDAAMDELKRSGYMVLIMLCERDDQHPLGTGMEVLCSETNNPSVLKAWALNALTEISGSEERTN